MTRLYRSTRDRKLSGLCGGLAEVLNVDATLLRLVVVVTAVFSAGTVILLYVLASIVIPKEPLPPYDYPNRGYTAPPPPPPPPFGRRSFTGYQSPPNQASSQQSNLDDMMKDVETKAMWKEIEELRAKLAKYEKGE